MGGMDKFNEAMNTYVTNFFDSGEQYAMQLESLSATFVSLDETLPTTNAGYRELLENTDTSTEAGVKLYATLLSLAGAFNQLTTAGDALAAEAQKKEEERLAKIAKAKEEADDEAYRQYVDNINRIKAANDKLRQDQISTANSILEFNTYILGKIEDAYTGSLSYLDAMQKSKYLGDIAQEKIATGDTKGYFDSLSKQLEYEKQMAATKEDYAGQFDKYIYELQRAEPELSVDEKQLETLNDILAQSQRIEDAIANSSFQKEFN